MHISLGLATLIVSVLLFFNGCTFGLSAWFLKRYIDRNDKEHKKFFEVIGAHETRISVIEVKE